MKKILSLLAFCLTFLGAIEIDNIKISKDKDNLNLFLHSTKSFTQNPKKFNFDNKEILLLKNTTYPQKYKKTFQNFFMDSIEVFTNSNNTYIVPSSNTPFEIKAFLSKDTHTIKVTFYKIQNTDNLNSLMNKQTELKPSNIELYDNSSAPKDYQYWLILGFMIILIVILFLIKKRFVPNFQIKSNKTTGFKILSSMNIDPSNKIVILQTQEYNYILLIGNKDSVVIDKIKITQNNDLDNDFWTLLKQKQNESNIDEAR